MNINKGLNLVVPIDSEKVYFHHTPIIYETFKKYHFVICSTFTKLMTNGMQLTGAKIAAMTLEETAKELGKWEGNEGVQNGLVEELARLTNVIVLSENGWEPIPVNVAMSRGFIQEEDWEEAKQKIVFFTLTSAMMGKVEKKEIIDAMNSIWLTQTTSSGCTEYAASLQMLKETETSRKKATQSSVPH